MSGGKVWRAKVLAEHPELRPAAKREQLARTGHVPHTGPSGATCWGVPACCGQHPGSYDRKAGHDA
jgi:hypothetical protein